MTDKLDSSESKPMDVDSARKWVARIDARIASFKEGWHKVAGEAQEMYNMERGYDPTKQNPFNILYSNTEVLLPALYSNTPRPDVRPRSGDDQDNAAQACEILLTNAIDDNVPGTQTFDSAMESATLGALVPGMGFARLRYFPDGTCPFQYETGGFDQLIWGYATVWAKVPWLSFEHSMTKEQIVAEFSLSEEDSSKLKVPTQADRDANDEMAKVDDETCIVHELWIKSSRKIVWLCSCYEEVVLKEENSDPLKLAGFFPTPGPLMLLMKSKSLNPTPLYEYYKDQATELNRVTIRLNKILSALKVRGVYNPLLGTDLQNVLLDDSSENKIIPATNPIDLQGKGFDNQVWTLPLEKLIVVAQQLYLARQQILQVIYQITGIADIVRGASAASETATAQSIKDKWSGVRLRRSQRKVGCYARDLLRLTVDAAVSVLPEDKWAEITQLEIPTTEQKKRAGAILAEIAAKAQSGMPPPQVPPQQMQQLQTTASGESWGDILSSLSNDTQRAYSIDIETYSTIDPDAQIDKEDVSEFMTALGQLVQGIAPLATLPGGVAVGKEILLAVAGKYKFGRSLTGAIKQLQPAPPQGGENAPPDHSLEVAQLRAQTDLQRTQMQTASSEKIAKLEAQVALLIEKMGAQADLQKEGIKQQGAQVIDMQKTRAQGALAQQGHEHNLQLSAVDSAREARQADQEQRFAEYQARQDRAFQANQGEADRQFQSAQGEANAKRALALGKQKGAQALAVQKSKPKAPPRRG